MEKEPKLPSGTYMLAAFAFYIIAGFFIMLALNFMGGAH